MKKQAKAVILLSGGMDSCVTLALAHQSEHKLYALHLNYGQLTEKKELKSFKEICKHYNIPSSQRLIIDVSHFKQIGSSALTDKSIPLNKSGKIDTKVPTSYVPFRNAHILSIAVSWAEVIKASKIYIGAVQEDSSGYPDCTAYFLRLFQRAANAGTKPETKLTIHAPLLHLSKTDIVQEGIKLAAPLHLTYSCYESNTVPCQKCDSCVLRAKGFKNAKVKDPILSN